MLVIFCLLSLFFIFMVIEYKWVVLVCSFFFFSFLTFFYFYSYMWKSSDIFFSYDVVSCFLVGLSVWLGGLILLANWRVYLGKTKEDFFNFLIILLVVVLGGCFFVSNFFQYYIFFEFSLIPTFLLILGWGYQPERMNASIYIIVYTVGASLPLLSCFLYCFYVEGHLSYLLDFSFFYGGFYGSIFFFILVFAFLVKIPVFFVHLWLPKAHVEAPVAGSMILAGVLLKLGGYGLLRVVSKLKFLLLINNFFYYSFILWGGVVTSLICLRQIDLKALVAYSSIGHIGLFVGGVIRYNRWGWEGGFLMLLGHGLCSPALFALANIGYESVGSRRLVLNKGFISFFPFLSMFWFIVCRRNIAAPPSLNLLREVILFIGVLGRSWILIVFLGLLSFFSGAYSLYLYTSRQHGAIGSFRNNFLPIKVRGFYLVLLHWVPLNLFILSGDLFSSWF